MSVQYRYSLDRTFHALGDATRRRMVALLSKRGECTAGELGKPFDLAQPTVSRHLRVLEEAGLVSRRAEGNTRHFRLEVKAMNEAEKWFVDQREFWKGALASMDQYLEDSQKAKKKRKNKK